DLDATAHEQGRSVFVVSSLLAVSTVAHVPANVVWLSRAARSAVRRTGRVLGDTVLDHYSAALGGIAHRAADEEGLRGKQGFAQRTQSSQRRDRKEKQRSFSL